MCVRVDWDNDDRFKPRTLLLYWVPTSLLESTRVVRGGFGGPRRRPIIARANVATWPAHGGTQGGATEVVKLAAQDDQQSSESSRAMEGGQPTRAMFSVSCAEAPRRSGLVSGTILPV